MQTIAVPTHLTNNLFYSGRDMEDVPYLTSIFHHLRHFKRTCILTSPAILELGSDLDHSQSKFKKILGSYEAPKYAVFWARQGLDAVEMFRKEIGKGEPRYQALSLYGHTISNCILNAQVDLEDLRIPESQTF